MPLIYITGISGSGKSAVLQELRRRGCTAYGIDENRIAKFYNNQTGEPFLENIAPKDRTPDWRSRHTWKAKRQDIEKLAAEAKDKPVFLCGVTANDADELWDLFDHVFALTLDEATLKHRIQTRTTNDFGKNEHEFRTLLEWQRTAAEDYEKLGATLVDATRPLSEVVDEIIRNISEQPSIPYFPQPDQTHCFQVVLKMTLKHYLPKEDFSWQELDDITAKAPGMWTWPTASILWLRDKGFDVHVAEDFDYVAFAEKGEQYLTETFGKEVAAEQVKHSNMQQEVELARKFIEAAKPVRHIPELQEIKQRLDEGYLVTCVVNSRKLNEQPGYTGHFILITGYDKSGFFAHDPDATANRFISFENLQAAWADPNEKAQNYIAIGMKE